VSDSLALLVLPCRSTAPLNLFLAYVAIHLPFAVRISCRDSRQLHPELEERCRGGRGVADPS
jgi:ABC-type Fe3+ transport system permease subunit